MGVGEARATHLPNYLIVLTVVPVYRHVFIIRVRQERLRLTGTGALHTHRPEGRHTSRTALIPHGFARRRERRRGGGARARGGTCAGAVAAISTIKPKT